MSWQPYERVFLPAVQCLAFDTHAELLWTGSAAGHVSSHFTAKEYGFSRYTSYRAHLPGPVQEILPDERGILSVGGSLKLANRRGVAAWNTYNEGNNLNMACYSNASSSEIVAGGTNIFGGTQPDLLCINAGSGTILRRVPSTAPITCVRRSNLVVCGQADGRIVLRDPRSLRAEQTITAHTNGLSALEVQGNCLLSIGYTIRQGVPVVDPLVKVFDIRARRPLPPVAFPSIPAFVKPHPRNNSMLFIASAQGHFQLADLSNPASIEFYTAETNSYLTAMTVAPTGQGLAFADADGIVDVWSAAPPDEEPVFARFSNPVEMPEPPEPPKHINWTPETPLNSIGMPYYDSQLFSYLPLQYYSSPYSPYGQPPRPIDPAVLATIKTVDFVGYAVNPKTTKRNQALAHGTKAREASRKMDVPLFRSEKERDDAAKRKHQGKSAKSAEAVEEAAAVSKREHMPKYYRKVEIKYSKFGVEDFDFGFYNKTPYSGLETHIVNSYTNALMQALRFVRPLRELAEGHIWTSCPRENCLLCEAGFLFKMLSDAKGVNCQASNFSKAFSSSQQANALGLMDIDDASSQVAYSSLIQICNRFLLETMNSEADRGAKNSDVLKQEPKASARITPSPLSQIMGLAVRTTSTCSHCGYRSSRESSTNVLDLVYPRKALSNETQLPTDFPAVFKASIAREAMTKVSCQGCRSLSSARVRRELTGAQLPPVLAVNTAVHTPDHVEMWLDKQTRSGPQRFLQPALAISPAGDRIVPLSRENMTDNQGMCIYELRAMVVQIQAEDDPAHLVSLVKVDESKSDNGQWHVFNDFLVKPVSEDEALSFPASWKIPAILYYQRVDVIDVLDFSALEVPPDLSILTDDVSTARNRKPSMIKHKVLRQDELPRTGTLVSIDAEFVSLQQEEVEYRSDGTKSLIRPSRMALARVSVLRGEGPSTGIPFIDDHIQVNEPIVDYLTEFSGIRPGDLDVKTSPHTLVPSKVAYKKLRLLVDLGCVFIGHGLNKDFRIINIFVPPSRILDTVNIYHLAHRHRKLSLRFLSWVVLHQDIQSSGSHDSIEDARTALQLYEKHSQLEAEGTWENTLEEIYREGGKLNWKVPGSDVSPVPTQRTHVQAPRHPHQGTLSAHLNRLHV